MLDSMWRGAVWDYNGNNSSGGVDSPVPPQTREDLGAVEWRGGVKQFAMDRHGGKANAGVNSVFGDLSARHVDIKGLWRLKWNPEFNTGGYLANVPGAQWPPWMKGFKE